MSNQRMEDLVRDLRFALEELELDGTQLSSEEMKEERDDALMEIMCAIARYIAWREKDPIMEYIEKNLGQ